MGVSTCDDETFSVYKRDWSARLQNIKLIDDMNTVIGQSVLAQLDEAYGYLRLDLAEIEAAKDKTEAIIRQNERSKAMGKNEDDRKKNATDFLENFPIGDEPTQTIDMYEMSRLMNHGYTIIKAFVDIINNKQQRLITMSGFLKLEKDLMPNS